MKLKKKLILLSIKMILSGFITEKVNKLMLRLAFSDKIRTPYLLFSLEQLLCKTRLIFANAEKTYSILLHHTNSGPLQKHQSAVCI